VQRSKAFVEEWQGDLTDILDQGDREIIALGRPDPVVTEAG